MVKIDIDDATWRQGISLPVGNCRFCLVLWFACHQVHKQKLQLQSDGSFGKTVVVFLLLSLMVFSERTIQIFTGQTLFLLWLDFLPLLWLPCWKGKQYCKCRDDQTFYRKWIVLGRLKWECYRFWFFVAFLWMWCWWTRSGWWTKTEAQPRTGWTGTGERRKSWQFLLGSWFSRYRCCQRTRTVQGK